jgi:hypothetical protein
MPFGQRRPALTRTTAPFLARRAPAPPVAHTCPIGVRHPSYPAGPADAAMLMWIDNLSASGNPRLGSEKGLNIRNPRASIRKPLPTQLTASYGTRHHCQESSFVWGSRAGACARYGCDRVRADMSNSAVAGYAMSPDDDMPADLRAKAARFREIAATFLHRDIADAAESPAREPEGMAAEIEARNGLDSAAD